MKYSSYNRESRSEARGKRRRTNLILNLLIGFVILLIIVVSSIIFLGGNDDNTSDKSVNKQTENKQDEDTEDIADNNKDKEDHQSKSKDETETNGEQTNNNETEQTDKEDKNKPSEQKVTPADKKDEVVTAGGENENVKNTIENPSWEPIGTVQTGEHTSVFDQDSVDWTEMIQAITYATGIDESNMTIWFLGNNGHNRAVGTISSKNQQEKYRVYIDWVDGKGWKPTKVEELVEIDKKTE